MPVLNKEDPIATDVDKRGQEILISFGFYSYNLAEFPA